MCRSIAVMQPYLFPYIGYFQLIQVTDTFVFFDDVQYIRRGYINSNNLLSSNGRQKFTAPVQKAPRQELIHNIKLKEEEYSLWRKKFLKTLQFQYQNAPNYVVIRDLVEEVLKEDVVYIHTLAKDSIISVCNYLELNTEFLNSSDLTYKTEGDGQDKIISICHLLNAERYINPINGQNLYSAEFFNANQIELNFIEPGIKSYPQFNTSFVSYLSIIDLLMFLNKEEIHHHLSSYTILKPKTHHESIIQ